MTGVSSFHGKVAFGAYGRGKKIAETARKYSFTNIMVDNLKEAVRISAKKAVSGVRFYYLGLCKLACLTTMSKGAECLRNM